MRTKGMILIIGVVASWGCSSDGDVTGTDRVSIQVTDPTSSAGGCNDMAPPAPDAGWPDAGPPTCGVVARAGFKANIDNSDDGEHLVTVVRVEMLDASGGLVQALDVVSAEMAQGGAFDGRVPARTAMTVVYDLDMSSSVSLGGELHYRIVFSVDGVERQVESATFGHATH